MKKLLIFTILVSNLVFAGGEISFEKQKENSEDLRQAQLEQIRKSTVVVPVTEEEEEEEIQFEDDKELGEVPKTKTINKLFNYIKSQNKNLSNTKINQILTHVFTYSKKHNVNPYLILAIMNVESHFNHSTISKAGAKGLMQLMPFNFKEFEVNNSIEGNIKGGILHLKRDYEKTKSIVSTLVCYNAGCSRLKNDAWKKIKETREYIPKVLEKYKNIIGL